MDFAFTADQEELRKLAATILDDHASAEQLKEIEADDDWFARRAWEELAKSGLVGIALGEEHGGGGLDFLDAAIVCEEIGMHVAPLPYLTHVVAAATIDEFGTSGQRSEWVLGAADGEVMLTLALQEPEAPDPSAPTSVAEPIDADWRIAGFKYVVPALHLAAAVLVPARTPDGVGVFLVATDAAGVSWERSVATNGEPLFELSLDGAPGELIGGAAEGTQITAWIVERMLAGLCVTQAGVSERTLRMTAEYASTREQFDHPIAAFQAVSQRTGDMYIDVEAIRLTAWQAAWRVSEGLPAADEVAIAKFWAADGGFRVANAAQHLHGGIGVDVDYPLHRYFWWSKRIELDLGGATQQLRRLGAALAAED